MKDLFAALDILVLQADDFLFRIVGYPPEWASLILPTVPLNKFIKIPFDQFSFLDNFLSDARTFWAENSEGRLKSGPFAESIDAEKDYTFEATALCLGKENYLLIELMGEYFKEQKKVLQLARGNLLVKEYLEDQVRLQTTQIRKREEEIVLRLVWAAEFRDNDTGTHIRRIGRYSEAMAKSLGWPIDDSDNIRISAPMHDIGKIGIPDSILLKDGKLTPDEWKIMITHASIGAQILGESDIPILRMACEIAQNHHEKWDGSGYPIGLSGEQIPQSARIVAVADVYDALIYERPYKPAFAEDVALEIIKKGIGSHFDPAIYDVFMSLLPEFAKIQEQLQAG